MSKVKVEDLSPAPFFARFLEGQSIEEMSREAMKAVCGGAVVTMAAPSDQEGAPLGELPGSLQDMIRRALEGGKRPSSRSPMFPCGPAVTMAYPSDGEGADDVPFAI
jgi:Serine endopeptidase inhibitors